MSWIVSLAVNANNWYYSVPAIKQSLKKDNSPLRIGVLGAAAINHVAIIDPVQTHPGATLTAIAARSQSRAEEQIAAHHLGPGCKAYGSYDEVIEDDNVDAVYIPLPNGLHAEWAIKALNKGKHVLVEKPIAANEDEARRIREAAQRSGKVALEAFHWRFHPAAHVVKEMVDSGDYGDVLEIGVNMKLAGGALKKDDIRFKYELAGGAAMDLTYVFSSSTYFASKDITKCTFDVHSATPRLAPFDRKVDEAIGTHFTISQEGKPAISVRTFADLAVPRFLGFVPAVWAFGATITISLSKAVIHFDGFPLPTFGHSITITDKETGKKTVKKCYLDGPQWGTKGQTWWSTYRYQLEAFVEQVKLCGKGKAEEWTGPWMGLDESVKLMSLIDQVYDKSGLGRRGLAS